MSDRCGQCGESYGAMACGPTHAMIANEILHHRVIREWITGLTDEQADKLRSIIVNSYGSATRPPHTRAALLALLPKEEP